jgi:gamma-glutamylcyclotransferase
MENGNHLYVFAYGSNLSTRRIRARVPSANPVASGYVGHRQIVFHKRSEDGSAKADAAFTAVSTDRVWGVVYRLASEEKPTLDQHESLGVGYDQEEVNVVLEKGSIQAWMYVARRDAIDPSLVPYSWYLGYVIQGAYEHQLPESHIDYLMGFQSRVDPDSARHARNRQLIVR